MGLAGAAACCDSAGLQPDGRGFAPSSLLAAGAAAETGPDRDQTDDLLVANEALYQLSYGPVERKVL